MFAGYWYPDDGKALQEMIALKPEEGKSVRSAILPHAGLFFSHRGINHYLARLDEQVSRIIMLAPSHYFFLEPNRILGSLLFDQAKTPFGNLAMFPLKGVDEGGEAQIQREHALEMVLPGLRMTCPNMAVAMGLISQVDEAHVSKLADVLLAQMDEHTALLASSDFTHYGVRFQHVPYGTEITDEVRHQVRQEDLRLAGLLAEGRWRDALAFGACHHSTVCGLAPSVITSCVNSRLGLVGKVVDSYYSWNLGGGVGESFVSYVTVLWSKP